MSPPIYAIYGASGCGRSIMPIARWQLEAVGTDKSTLVFIDDVATSSCVNGHSIFSYKDFRNKQAHHRFVAIAISNSVVRESIALRLKSDSVSIWSVRASNVVVMDDVEIGEGAILSPFVTISSNTRIGSNFHGNLYSYVEHDCTIGDYVTFAPGVKCNGNVVVEDHAYVGAGAMLRQGKPGLPLKIGRGAVVGMGAVVTSDVEAGSTVVGNPARPLEGCQ